MTTKTTMGGGRGPIRQARGEEAFTLIELMVAVLIIGILIAIALPTFIGARERAANRALQSDLRTGLVSAMSYYVSNPNRSYSGYDVPTAEEAESSVEWVASQPQKTQIDIEYASGDQLLLVGQSRSGTYFCLGQVWESPLTIKGKSSTFANVDTMSECTGGW